MPSCGTPSSLILRMVATARYLHLKAELHDAFINAHITIGDNLEEKIRLRDQGPDIEASAKSAALLTDHLAAMSTNHQQAQAAATFNEERARLAKWDANQLRGQLGLAQQDLIRARNAHTAALGQAHAQAADLDQRGSASTSLDRGADPLFGVPDQFVVIVSCAGRQRIIIVLEPYGSTVSG